MIKGIVREKSKEGYSTVVYDVKPMINSDEDIKGYKKVKGYYKNITGVSKEESIKTLEKYYRDDTCVYSYGIGEENKPNIKKVLDFVNGIQNIEYDENTRVNIGEGVEIMLLNKVLKRVLNKGVEYIEFKSGEIIELNTKRLNKLGLEVDCENSHEEYEIDSELIVINNEQYVIDDFKYMGEELNKILIVGLNYKLGEQLNK